MIISSLEHISEFHHSFSSNVGISSLVTEFISRTSFWVLFCRTKWFNVIIIKLLVLPLNCFKRTIFSEKIPCPVINIFPGMVVEVLFVTWCFYNTYIRDRVYSKYISEIMKQQLEFLSMPYSYRALFQQSYDDALFSS